MKISQKITALLLLFSLTPILLVGVLIFLSIRTYIRDQVETSLITTADLREQQLYQLANKKLEELAIFTNNLNLQILLKDYQAEPRPETLDAIEQIIAQEKFRNRDLNEIYIIDPNGRLLATTYPFTVSPDWSTQSFFAESKTRAVATFIKSEAQLAPQLLLSGPVTVEGKLAGIVVLDSDTTALIPLTSGAEEIGQTAEIFLINRNGPITPLKQNTPIQPGSLLDRANQLVSERDRAVYPDFLNYKGSRSIAVTRFIDIFDLGLIVQVDQQEAYRPTLEILTFLVTISLILTILAAVAAYFLSQSISGPILRLAAASEAVKKGNLKTRVQIDRRDEFGLLAETFNDTIASIQRADQTKNEFISLASHQLRTPLSATRWTLELLLDKKTGRLNEKQISYLNDIKDSTDRMVALTRALLDASRIEGTKIKLKPQPVDLKFLINDVLMELRPRLEQKKLTLTSHLPDLPKTNQDIELTSVVYRNIISNAIKYTPPGGKITITVSKEDSHLLTKITDTGVGIAKKDLKRVFHKFFRGKNAVAMEPEGSGLGLYLAKTIIDSSGGRIWFESKLNKGTTFWFTLPLTKEPISK